MDGAGPPVRHNASSETRQGDVADGAVNGRRVPPKTSDKAVATRAALVELAADLFATRGYLQTSIRDIARAASLTSGAIYGHFRNKADLLAEAISLHTTRELENAYRASANGPTALHVMILRRLTGRYPERRRLRALILQGAAAAVTDPETRERLREEQMEHLQVWIDGYEAHRDELGLDPSIDVHDAVLYTWAGEVGLGVLEAIGITPHSKKNWADMAARFGRALTLSPDEVDAAPQATDPTSGSRLPRSKGATKRAR
jgi:AcrR family transcriptional regulator